MRVIGLAALMVMAFVIACGEPEITATPTAPPTAKPTQTPISTPTPTEAQNLTVRIGGQIDDKVQEQGSSCYVDRNIDATITMFSSRSINYLRTYLKSPNLSESNVRSIINFLESQRGQHQRLCTQERGGNVPKVENVSDIVEFYNNGLNQKIQEGKNCELAELSENYSSTFSHENINFARGFFNAPWLNHDHMLQMIAHFESEAGRYAGLCDKKISSSE